MAFSKSYFNPTPYPRPNLGARSSAHSKEWGKRINSGLCGPLEGHTTPNPMKKNKDIADVKRL